MTGRQRVGLLFIAAAVVLTAVLVLRPESDSSKNKVATTPAAPATTARQPATATAPTTSTKPPAKPPTLLTADKVTKITVNKGDTVRFSARAGSDEEIHVHGYDLSKDAPANTTVSMSFPATLEGVFEIEFEKSGTEIAQLQVNP